MQEAHERRNDSAPASLELDAADIRRDEEQIGTSDDRAALLDLTDLALTHLDLDVLLPDVLRRLHAHLRIDTAAVLLLNDVGDALVVRAALGLEEDAAAAVRVPVGEGFAGRIAAAREPLVATNLAAVGPVSPVMRERVTSAMGVPLIVGGRLLGVLHVGSARRRRFTAADLRLLRRAGDRVAVAVDHAQLFRQAAEARAEAEARARELEAVLDAIADGVVVYDLHDRMLHANATARGWIAAGPAAPADRLAEPHPARALQRIPRDVRGEPLPEDQWPRRRAQRGEIVTGARAADILLRAPDGQDRLLNQSAAPIRDAEGRVVGAVVVTRDVTERSRLEQRTLDTLDALLALAGVLVEPAAPLPVDDAPLPPAAHADPSVRLVAPLMRRIAALTGRALGCRRVAVAAVESETEVMHPITLTGFTEEEAATWWANWVPNCTVAMRMGESVAARLRAGEVVQIDMGEPAARERLSPYHVRTLFVAPMHAAGRMVGMLAFDDAGVERIFTERDRELAGAVAKLAGLVVERDRLLAEREAARANELALREANRRMDAFLGIASHELRTPMTVIKMNTQLAQQQLRRLAGHAPAADSATARSLAHALHLLEQAARQIKRQERLVGDLLEVSRIQAGTFELLPEPCDLAKIVREAVAEQRLSNPGRTITLAGAGEPVPMVADPDRIGQVVTNYLTNALKYSPAAAPVAITIRRDDGPAAAVVEVRDEGPGIPPEEQERIWQRFHRVPGIGVLSGSGVGLGLGLHISREIVERHGGAVGLESEIGRGSTFWFTLPLDATPPA